MTLRTSSSATLLSRLRHHVDQSWFPASHNGSSPLNRGAQIFGVANWTFGVYPHPLRDLGVVDERIFQHATNSGAIDTSLMAIRHPLKMHHFLMIRTVIVHDT